MDLNLNPQVLENAASYAHIDTFWAAYTGGRTDSAFLYSGDNPRRTIGEEPGSYQFSPEEFAARDAALTAWNATHEASNKWGGWKGPLAAIGFVAGGAALATATGVTGAAAVGASEAGYVAGSYDALELIAANAAIPVPAVAASSSVVNVLTGVAGKVAAAGQAAVESAATSAVVSKLLPKPEIPTPIKADVSVPTAPAPSAPISLFDQLVDFLWKLLSPATSA